MRRRELLSLALGLGTSESVFAVSADSEADGERDPLRVAVAAGVSGCERTKVSESEWCDGGEPKWCDEVEPEWCDEVEPEWCDEVEPEWCDEEELGWCDGGESEWVEARELPESLRYCSIERLDAECATGQTGVAKVHTADGHLRLCGVIEAPTPCYDIALEGIDEDEGTVEVVVEVTDPLDGFCVQCVGAIRYEVRLAFEVDPPKSVEIVHRTMGETRRIEPRSATDPR